MRASKIQLNHTALALVLGLGVPAVLSGCEIHMQREGDSDVWDDESSSSSGHVRHDPPPLDDDEYPAAEDPDYGDVGVDREPERQGPGLTFYTELIVLDPQLLQGTQSDSGNSQAAWSFRRQMAWLAGGDADALDFSARWLSAWRSQASVGPSQAPVTPRPDLGGILLYPWLGEGTAAAATGSTYTGEATHEDVAPPANTGTPEYPPPAPSSEPEAPPHADPTDTPRQYAGLPASLWGVAPFRLLAIVNRVDLAADACSGSAGELRYVYTGTLPNRVQPLDVTVIVEIPYPRTRSAAGWARAWSQIGEAGDREARRAALLALTAEVAAEADPLRVRVRTNEGAFGGASAAWQMRQFDLAVSAEGDLDLHQVPLALTPRADADRGLLAEHLVSHADEVFAGTSELPEALRAGAADIPTSDFSWQLPGVSERLRQAFSVQTCNGCHAGDTGTTRFQHIAPSATLGGPARLSRYLYDESASSDELRRRRARLQEFAATLCEDEEPPSGAYYGLR